LASLIALHVAIRAVYDRSSSFAFD